VSDRSIHDVAREVVELVPWADAIGCAGPVGVVATVIVDYVRELADRKEAIAAIDGVADLRFELVIDVWSSVAVGDAPPPKAQGFFAIQVASGRFAEAAEVLVAEQHTVLLVRTLGSFDYVALVAFESESLLTPVADVLTHHPAIASISFYRR
jgi:hypothetical protein